MAGAFQIAGFGEVLWDMLPSGKQLGGAPANFAYFCRVLGAEAHVVSAIGKDDLGRDILHRLAGLGLNSQNVQPHRDRPTGTVQVRLDAHGIPSYIIHENVSWDSIELTDQISALAPKLDAVCFGTLSQRSQTNRATLDAILSLTRPGCLRVFDVNLRQHYYDAPTIRSLLRKCNVLKLNDEELPVIATLLAIPMQDERGMLQELVTRYSLQLAALTRGARGSRLQTPTQASEDSGRPVGVRDTVGAGDAFTASMVMDLLRGTELPRLHHRAARLAEFVCEQNGATPAVDQVWLQNR